MTRQGGELVLVYEPEPACRARLAEQGFGPDAILEISSYLAQSTDMAPELDAIGRACAERSLDFHAIALDDAARVLARSDPGKTLVWTLTDGIAYFRGGAAPALARLAGLRTIGSDDSLFALCQDKFRSGAVLSALGAPVPLSGLARNGTFLVEPPASASGWFVKPNRLGAKIGIWHDSHCRTTADALSISRRVHEAYRDDCVVQPYVPGRNVRASFLAVDPSSDENALGIFYVDGAGDFQTMADSLSLYGETGAAARVDGRYREPELVEVVAIQPEADRTIRRIAARLVSALGLRDVFSMDFRVEPDGRVHLIEFEICPGLPCFDFRDYCRRQWGMGLAEAMAETASRRFVSRPA